MAGHAFPTQVAAADASANAPDTVSLRFDTPSGLPVPRFVSTKSTQTYCRGGPSFDHPIKLTFMRKGLPVLVIAETRDHWRKVRDVDGDACWVHHTKLSGAQTAIVLVEGLEVYARPSDTAAVRARLGAGLLAEIKGWEGEWARIDAGDASGWALRDGLWGGRLQSTHIAAQN
ncbi:MAG: SH3 domain-containing protein [Pseudomonadota bacterium]